jgi:hypothetical protein
VSIVCFVGQHGDGAAVVVTDPLDEAVADPAEPISMGNDNLADHSSHDLFQKPLEAVLAEVDGTADFRDDLVDLDLAPDEVDLAAELLFLALGGDSSISDDFL